ncbi:MAG: hypothetical protein Kow0090_07910 [Myxococcota bacterium]
MKKIWTFIAIGVLAVSVSAQEKKTEEAKKGTESKEGAAKVEKSEDSPKSPAKTEYDLSDYAAFENGLERGNSDLVNAWVKHRCKYNEDVYGTKCEETLELAQGRDCISGKEESCLAIGRKYQNQEYGYIWLKYACLRHSIGEACYLSSLSIQARKDRSEADKLAMTLLAKGCDNNHPGCCDMGGFINNRNGKEKEALDMWSKVCHPAENWSACGGAGNILFKQGRLFEALDYYERACAPNIFERQRFCRKAEIIFEKIAEDKAKKIK